MCPADPEQIALQFNEQINRHDLAGLAALMSADHRFVDRAGNMACGKAAMLEAWGRFFEMFPEYQNTFTRVEIDGSRVRLYGYATWKPGDAPDFAIWTATIENDLVVEWRIDESQDMPR